MTITNLVCGASVGLGLLLGAGACTRRQSYAAPALATTPTPGSSAVTHAQADGVEPPQSTPCGAFTHEGQASEFHQGVLTYREPPRVMSVDAYRHVEFSLHTRERKLALATSPSVAWEQLHRARDGEVSVCCAWTAGPTPTANEAAPSGPDGQPLARPSRCVVLLLTDGPL